MAARPISGKSKSPIPRYRASQGPALFSAGFRPFFLLASIWAAVAVPLWLGVYAGGFVLPSRLDPVVWHVHEMVYGFAAGAAAGFMLTMIPNWTGRMPLQGPPLAMLVLLWSAGRIGVLCSAAIGAPAAAAADLAFPAIFLAAIAREIAAGRNWRNLPMLAALTVLLLGNALVHCEALGLAQTAALGNRIGIATFLMLIALVGGRMIPSFTRNRLAKSDAQAAFPAATNQFDQAALAVTGLALAAWVLAPDAAVTAWAATAAGLALLLRLLRWRGWKTAAEPLLFILHLGYAWLALGLLLLGLDGLYAMLPPGAALHALTAGAIGTMTLGVMTRASLSHTGHRAKTLRGTFAIYLLITAAAVLRVLAPLAGDGTILVLWLAGAAWSAAFALFAILYGRVLAKARPITAASSNRR
jgi:uncharacterized protein involved in response to NO